MKKYIQMQLSPGKNVRLFKNDVLEMFSYVHPIVPLLIWVPVLAYCFSVGVVHGDITFASSLTLWVSGLLVWTLAEYVLHRFVFHFKPNGPIQERIAFLIHGIHHEDPADERRLLMPPAAAVVLAVFFYFLYSVIFGPVRVNPFFSGFIAGYLVYDYIHFSVHYFKPRSEWFKRLKQNHMLHHFSTPQQRFGVSSVIWDQVFSTTGTSVSRRAKSSH